MNYEVKPRAQKIVEKLYPFFAEIAEKSTNDRQALIVCRQIRAHKTCALDTPEMQELRMIWDRDHPEEALITNDELHWALETFDEHISRQIRNIEIRRTRTNHPKAMMKLINGGLSKEPDRCIVKESPHFQYPDY